jgi:hypothetical protein
MVTLRNYKIWRRGYLNVMTMLNFMKIYQLVQKLLLVGANLHIASRRVGH